MAFCQTRDIEARFRKSDEEVHRLSSQLKDAQTACLQLEQELRDASKRSDEDKARLAAEVSRLNGLLVGHVSLSRGGPDGVPQYSEMQRQIEVAQGEVHRLTQERQTILLNWKAENERMTTAWQQERNAWIAERDSLAAKVPLDCLTIGVGSGYLCLLPFPMLLALCVCATIQFAALQSVLVDAQGAESVDSPVGTPASSFSESRPTYSSLVRTLTCRLRC